LLAVTRLVVDIAVDWAVVDSADTAVDLLTALAADLVADLVVDLDDFLASGLAADWAFEGMFIKGPGVPACELCMTWPCVGDVSGSIASVICATFSFADRVVRAEGDIFCLGRLGGIDIVYA
jgi:hypothetical protein